MARGRASRAKSMAAPQEEKAPRKRRKEPSPEPEPEAPEASAEQVAEAPPARKRARGASAEPLVVPELFTQAGAVYVCGQGDSGQLALGPLDDDDFMEVHRPKPAPLPNGAQVKQVAAGGMHSVALSVDGQVFTAGVNDEAALGRRTDAEIWEKSELAPGTASDAAAWGRVSIPDSHGSVVQVSAGDSHTMALTSQGAVWGWGCFRGESGVHGFAPDARFQLLPALVYAPGKKEEQVLRIASGADHVLAVRRDGSALSWGFGKQGQLGRLSAAGERQTRRSDQDMLRPGAVPLHNIAGYGRRKFRAAGVAACSYGSFLVSDTHEAVAFGVNVSGQLGLTVQGGTVGQNIVHRPKLVGPLREAGGVAQLGPGKSHSLALTPGGQLLSFGLQTYGRLGRPDADVRSDAPLPPGPVGGLPAGAAVAAISGGHDTSAAVTEAGQAFLWGMGSNCQLGKASDSDEKLPRQLQLDGVEGGPQRVLQVAFGGQHTLLLLQ